MKTRPLGAEFPHEDRRTDMKLIVSFRNLANAINKTVNVLVTLKRVRVTVVVEKQWVLHILSVCL